MPTCTDLATATVAQQRSLTDCAGMNHSGCVDRFCELYGQFQWRMRPYNLLPEVGAGEAKSGLYDPEFVLPGCESMAQVPFDDDRCHRRKDVVGFCSCICE